MVFAKTNFGIFVIAQDPNVIAKNGTEDAAFWATFLVDSDSDWVRQMSETIDTDTENSGIEIKFVISAMDQNQNLVRICYKGDNKGSTEKNLFVH